MILSPDHYLYTSEGVYEWTPSRVSSAWAMVTQAARQAMADPRTKGLCLVVGLPGSGKSTYLSKVVPANPHILFVDATFTNEFSRRVFCGMAQDTGKPISAVVIDTPLEVCLERNARRSDDRKIPVDAILRMERQLQAEPPTHEEGFSEITILR